MVTEERREQLRRAARAYRERNREEQNRRAREYIAADRRRRPERYRARDKLNYEIKVGRLERGVCEVCGAAEAHAHHEDYSRPLDVRWFCRTHHMEQHRG